MTKWELFKSESLADFSSNETLQHLTFLLSFANRI
jgi:hypothetical protein